MLRTGEFLSVREPFLPEGHFDIKHFPGGGEKWAKARRQAGRETTRIALPGTLIYKLQRGAEAALLFGESSFGGRVLDDDDYAGGFAGLNPGSRCFGIRSNTRRDVREDWSLFLLPNNAGERKEKGKWIRRTFDLGLLLSLLASCKHSAVFAPPNPRRKSSNRDRRSIARSQGISRQRNLLTTAAASFLPARIFHETSPSRHVWVCVCVRVHGIGPRISRNVICSLSGTRKQTRICPFITFIWRQTLFEHRPTLFHVFIRDGWLISQLKFSDRLVLRIST